MDNRYILGIDAGTNAVKAFVGSLAPNGSVLIIGSGTAPTIGFVKGIITDPQALATAIKQAIDCANMATGIAVNDAYIGIGGVALHSVNSVGSIAPLYPDSITLVDMKRVYKAAALVGLTDEYEVLHVLPQKFFVDKQQQVGIPLQKKGSHLEVEAHIVAVSKDIINSLVNAIEKLGIGVLGVVANSVVVAEPIKPIGVDNCLLMDIGAGTAELILYRQGQIYVSASLPLGGNYITSDIMQGLTIEWNHAEDIKRYYAKLDKLLHGQEIILDCNDYGTSDKLISYDFLYDIVESRISEIVYLLHEYLEDYLAEVEIEKVFLTGGCGAMPSFVQGIETKFQRPVEVLTPKELPSEYMTPENAVCYGVLQYAAKNLPTPIVTTESGAWRGLISKFKKVFNS
jgi:cell division protein FtsA